MGEKKEIVYELNLLGFFEDLIEEGVKTYLGVNLGILNINQPVPPLVRLVYDQLLQHRVIRFSTPEGEMVNHITDEIVVETSKETFLLNFDYDEVRHEISFFN